MDQKQPDVIYGCDHQDKESYAKFQEQEEDFPNSIAERLFNKAFENMEKKKQQRTTAPKKEPKTKANNDITQGRITGEHQRQESEVNNQNNGRIWGNTGSTNTTNSSKGYGSEFSDEDLLEQFEADFDDLYEQLISDYDDRDYDDGFDDHVYQ